MERTLHHAIAWKQHGKWQFTGLLKLYLIDVWEERHGSLSTVGTAKIKAVLVDYRPPKPGSPRSVRCRLVTSVCFIGYMEIDSKGRKADVKPMT